MFTRLFKYTQASTALIILENRRLRWRAPESFNDPFELKDPFGYGFEWDEMTEVALQSFAKILTQREEPSLADGNPVATTIKERLLECKGKDPVEVRELVRPRFQLLVQKWKEDAVRDAAAWQEMKKTYRVLCLSAVHDHILMWSYYACSHQGVVFAFQPVVDLNTATLFAQPAVYSTEVPVAATLEQFVGYLTGGKLKPAAPNAFRKSVYTKRSVWAYEKEWRILDKERPGKTVSVRILS